MNEDRTDAWMAEVRRCVNARLESYLQDKHAEAVKLSEESVELVDAIRSLTMRGGKRLRAAVVIAAYEACKAPHEGVQRDEGVRDEGVIANTVDVCAALELLQTYFLIHDDWMDNDDQRRGAPAVHAHFAGHYKNAHLGAAVAILAGDLASVYAWELLSLAPFRAARRAESFHAFVRLQAEVFFGQHLDLVGTDDVSRMHQLKTGSYTVRGPALLGGILGDATPAQLDDLERFAAPLGLAFQLRDDLLGTFGDAAAMGKPAGNDLRVGKRTALAQAAQQLLNGSDRQVFEAAFGNAVASEAQIAAATGLLVSCGAKAQVEEDLQRRLEQARQALAEADFSLLGKQRLAAVGDLLVDRSW